ncbi:DUF4233 domain-containing protein [Micromonospora sp. DT46]|uniref:DUF4233 domain-containing protein n=1 Tax=unclassified Micromonospora TaxID=2617518 RepID=UPI001CEC3C5F|nr:MULTISPECIES: DUF4233 domain-containing protein [unclassified Micromonospora]WSG02172.1 DUF4233 domain-containing protein [Micromonospora sp. NBC_01740]
MTGPERATAGDDRPTGAPDGLPGDLPASTSDGTPDDGAVRAADGNPAGRPPRRSGLRNPERAVRGLGAGTLSLEALVLVLAIQPIRVVGGDLGGAAIGAVVALAVAAVLLAGMMRRPWAWHAGTALQGLLMLAGLLHWSLLVLGVVFALVWGYALHVRRVILG